MKPLEQGTFFYMPMLQRAINRTSGVIKRFMFKANAEEIAIPALAPIRLWKESGRFESFRDNLYVMEDKSQLLGPVFSQHILWMICLMLLNSNGTLHAHGMFNFFLSSSDIRRINYTLDEL